MLLNMLAIFTQLRDWSGQIGHRIPRAVILTLAALATLVLFVLVLPPVMDLLRASWTRVAEMVRGSTAGFIFVESPEVYTRQRLVNDRNLQDAWLRRELEKVDDAGNSFIDRTESIESYLRAMVTLAEAGGPDSGAAKSGAAAIADPDQALKDLPVADIPFGTEFALRSAVRDKIRQLILENALDDRHDLSGNTILGLKFDTAVIPGPNTTDYPAVFVRMAETPLDRLKRANTSSLSLYLLGAPGSEKLASPSDRKSDRERQGSSPENGPDDAQLAEDVKGYFREWNDSLNGRIRQHLSDNLRPSTVVADVVTRRHLDIRLCGGGSEQSEPTVEALSALRSLLQTGDNTRAFNAVSYVLRLDPIDHKRIQEDYLGALRNAARKYCQLSLESEPATVGRFLSREQAVSLPPPWGKMFSLSIMAQIWTQGGNTYDRTPGYSGSLQMRPETAQVEFVPKLTPLTVRILFVDEKDVDKSRYFSSNKDLLALQSLPTRTSKPRDALYSTGWSPLGCGENDCGTSELVPWINYLGQNYLFPIVRETIGASEVKAIFSYLNTQIKRESHGQIISEFCLYYSEALKLWAESKADGHWSKICTRGLPEAADFQLGAFNFLRRMARVESYTYAAFPKGDVSGIVMETIQSTDASASVSGPGGTAEGAIGAGESRHLIETMAKPSMVNFAPGPRHSNPEGEARPEGKAGPDEVWNFDFGWAIVKDGRMKPMLASQVVLVSVPGFTNSLELETWQGFLDPRRFTIDRIRKLNALDLDQRIKALLPTFEKQTIQVNLPPDYSALDGLITGSSLVRGPAIDKRRLTNDKNNPASFACRGQEKVLSIVIPGERLWRSTTVTLDGLKADQIEVMPDMRGIRAEFNLPSKASFSHSPILQVWTSEGSDSITLPAKKIDGSKVTCQ